MSHDHNLGVYDPAAERHHVIAAMNAWEWAEYDDPQLYADLHHHGPATQMPAQDPAIVREQLAAAIQARRK